MLLNDVKSALKEIDRFVFYGLAPNRIEDEDGNEVHDWNYTVFNRAKLKNSANKTGYTDVFEVHIVREEFIPEGIDLDIIGKLTAIPGVKLASDDGVYDYTKKPGTENVVEMLTLTFVRARK